MYEIHFANKSKKRYKKLLAKLSQNEKDELRTLLENNPFPRASYGNSLCKIEAKGSCYGTEVSGGDRVLFNVVKDGNDKYVLILYAGNHDGELLFLRKHGKKKRR